MAAYLSLTHTDAEATPFLLTPPDLLRDGRYLRNNMDLAVHRAIHNPLHSLSCAINDPWGTKASTSTITISLREFFLQFPNLTPFFSMIAEEPRQWRGSLTSQKGALRHLPGRSLCDFSARVILCDGRCRRSVRNRRCICRFSCFFAQSAGQGARRARSARAAGSRARSSEQPSERVGGESHDPRDGALHQHDERGLERGI